MKLCRFVENSQITLGASIFAYALFHAYETFRDRNTIKPFSVYGWNAEQYQISLICGVLALILVSLAKKEAPRNASIAVSFFAAMFFWALFMRYFWMSQAIFATACFGLAQFANLTIRERRSMRWWIDSMVLSGLSALALLVFLYGYLSRGN